MASLHMHGPYVLIPDKIDEAVAGMNPGNYALGYVSERDFIVLYIGRSDTDLNRELKDWVYRKSDCIFFKFSTAKSAEEAFEVECINFHDFGGCVKLKNEKHPERPSGTDWKCPRCDVYG